jgi:diguanylate cyclase (GGDEF)-like protein
MDTTYVKAVRRPPPALRGKPRMLVASQLLLALVIATMTGLLVLNLHERTLTAAGREQAGLALVLADQAERAFEAVELVQGVIDERLQAEGVRTPDALRQIMSTAAMREELRRRVRPLPQLDAIIISDAAGNVINSSRPGFSPASSINVADRDFFAGLRDHRERTLFISEPVQARATGNWAVYIARKVAGREGEFLGTIQGAVELSYFERLYQSVAPGPESSIALSRQDGRLLARYPHIDLAAEPTLATSQPFEFLNVTGAKKVEVRTTGALDGRERLVAARALVHYPIVVTVTQTISSLLAEWRKQAIYLAASAIILELLVAGVGMLMLRQFRSHRMLNGARAAAAEAEASRRGAEAELAIAHERERADRALRVQNIRFGAALDNMSQSLCLFDASDRLVFGNARHGEMFALPVSRLLPGTSLESLLNPADGESNLSQSDLESMRRSIANLKAAGVRAAFIRDLADGRTLAGTFVRVENEGWLVTFEDITERRQAADKITHMAHHDALTGLPNRILFHARLTEAVARSRRGEPCAVLYLDLDHFKAVNDTLGHPVGDALLQEVTIRLLTHVRKLDTMARLGGDEFAIVQSSVNQPHDALALATRLIEELGLPYEIDGQQVLIGTSIGIALVPEDGQDPDQILKNADMALYGAKADGRGRYRFFTPEMDARMQARRILEIDLRRALTTDQFALFYQPLVNLRTGSVIGFEALMRWFHPDRGMISPADFIPLAEEIGLLVPLGKWALRQACLDAMSWPGPMKVAVNVSVTQFSGRTLVEDVAAALAESRLDPARLELEITETVMLEETDAVLLILHQLRNLGVGIAMDDFGTGYSSLSYLRRFPFSKVKIDRSFVAGLGKGGDCEAIVAAVIKLCATLGMTVLAEGVETEDQLQRLHAVNCGEAQGYLFSRPCPTDKVAALCRMLSQRVLEVASDRAPTFEHMPRLAAAGPVRNERRGETMAVRA